MVKYINLDDSIKYIEFLIKEHQYPIISAKNFLETALKQNLITPLFNFSGYASISDASKTRFSEVRQIMSIKGFFKDPYFSEYADKTKYCSFLNLSLDKFGISPAQVYEITYVDVLKFAIPYSSEYPAGGYHATLRDHIELAKGDTVWLYNEQPRIDSDLSLTNAKGDRAELDNIYVSRNSVFFLIDDLKKLFSTNEEEQTTVSQKKLLPSDNHEIALDKALKLLESKEKVIQEMKAELDNIKNGLNTYDKELMPNSEAKAVNLIYILLMQTDYKDKLTPKGKGKVNQSLMSEGNRLGINISENTIAYWLKRAYQIQLENASKDNL